MQLFFMLLLLIINELSIQKVIFMVSVPVLCKSKVLNILVPSELKDFTLEQKCKYSEYAEDVINAEADIEIFIDKLEDLKFNLEMEGKEITEEMIQDHEIEELELRLKRSEIIRNQLLAVIPETEHHKVNSLDEISLEVLKRAIAISERKEIKMVSSFTLVDGTIPDIKALEAKLEKYDPVEHSKEIAEINIKINRLKKGEFICLPASDVIFEAKLATDKVLEKYPSLPEELTTALDEMGMDLTQYIKQSSEGKTPEELKQRSMHLRMVKNHHERFKAGKIRSAAALLSHVCVPYGEPYDYLLANERAEYFLQLDMETVEGLLAFFLIASQISTRSLPNYSSQMAELISLNALSSSKETGVGLLLSDWFYDRLLTNQKKTSLEKEQRASTTNS